MKACCHKRGSAIQEPGHEGFAAVQDDKTTNWASLSILWDRCSPVKRYLYLGHPRSIRLPSMFSRPKFFRTGLRLAQPVQADPHSHPEWSRLRDLGAQCLTSNRRIFHENWGMMNWGGSQPTKIASPVWLIPMSKYISPMSQGSHYHYL